MLFFKHWRVLAHMVGVAALLCTVAPLSAQQKAARVLPAPRVAVIDFQRAVRQSAAGLSVVRQINERHAKFQKEIQVEPYQNHCKRLTKE